MVGIEQGASITSIASIEQAAGIAGIEQAAAGDHLNVSFALSGSSQHHLAAPSSLASKFTFQVFRFSGFQFFSACKNSSIEEIWLASCRDLSPDPHPTSPTPQLLMLTTMG